MPYIHRICLIIVLFLSACVTPRTQSQKIDAVAQEIEAKKQRELVVEDYVNAYQRLYRVGYPILVKAIPFCEKITHDIGLNVWSAAGDEKEWREAYQSLYDLTDLIQISLIIENGPADQAGLKKGDILVSLDDWSVPVGEEAEKKFFKKLSDLSDSNAPIKFRVRREEEELLFTVKPEQVCNYPIIMEADQILNAFADGKQIIFTKGMMDFFRTDQEIALVFSHELAHNTMKHIEAKKTNRLLGTAGGFIVDLLGAFAGINTQGTFSDMGARAGRNAYSPEFETEADYVGLYIMASTGHKIDNASHFWRRMSLKDSRGINLTTSHPANAARFVGIENTIKEIKKKIAAGEPLKPEMKE